MASEKMTNEELLNRFSNESVVIADSLTRDVSISHDYRNGLRAELLRRLNAYDAGYKAGVEAAAKVAEITPFERVVAAIRRLNQRALAEGEKS